MTEEAGTRCYEVQTSDGAYCQNRRALMELHVPDIPDQMESNEAVIDTSSNHTAKPLVRRSSHESRPPDGYDPSWN